MVNSRLSENIFIDQNTFFGQFINQFLRIFFTSFNYFKLSTFSYIINCITMLIASINDF